MILSPLQFEKCSLLVTRLNCIYLHNNNNNNNNNANQSDIVIKNKRENKCNFIDLAIPSDKTRVHESL